VKYFFGGDAELGDGVPASRLPVGDVFPGVAVLIVRVSSEMRTGETQLIYLLSERRSKDPARMRASERLLHGKYW
jgi:hypothetical protein